MKKGREPQGESREETPQGELFRKARKPPTAPQEGRRPIGIIYGQRLLILRYSHLYVVQLLAGYTIGLFAAVMIDDKRFVPVAAFFGFLGSHFVYLSYVLRLPPPSRVRR